MGDSGSSVSIDGERISFGGKEHRVETSYGPISVAVYGDQDKPALVTYPDIGLNHMACFQGLFFYPEAVSLLLHNFCIYNISPPGHELAAAPISSDIPVPSVDDLADQVSEILDFFGLGNVYGGHSRAASWTEWLYDKVLLSNLLYFYGLCGLFKNYLLQRYFSKELLGDAQIPGSAIVQACRCLLEEKRSTNVLRFFQSINGRYDLTAKLKLLKCKTLIFVGENSPFHSESLHMMSNLDQRCGALVEVQACGSLVTEEQPHAMLIPLEFFLMGYGLYRPCLLSGNPCSPLSPISPELLSPESMGLKLKPIKTRISFQA